MAQTSLTVRIDSNLKKDAERLFNRMGMNMSVAVNMFFRQALSKQTLPFEPTPYDDYFTGDVLERLDESIEQEKRGEIITKTFAELKVMESDDE
ncbi:MAG: type II toxin-antitoxin system RelB/DinJ family antitoxin [Oscillospiraceae bacterium]|jgi:DNA-damage-inducible protein J|nr:type II toxin-antitoxin system RelB/DinJ family antitoxin [Oscillospiraceae bacterium]